MWVVVCRKLRVVLHVVVRQIHRPALGHMPTRLFPELAKCSFLQVRSVFHAQTLHIVGEEGKQKKVTYLVIVFVENLGGG